jgi:hypothetical protein
MPDDFVFEPVEMVRILVAHEVEFVLIGGYAAVLYGSAMFTTDADICPDPSLDNLARLAAALREMDARIRTDAEPEGLPFVCDEHFLSQMKMVNLMTRYGAFDISFAPAASNGYEDLIRGAVDYDLDGVPVKLAALGDIIRSKSAANRPKDQQALPHLYALQDEVEKRRQD